MTSPSSSAPPDIIDGHCHVASSDFTPELFVDGVVANMVAALHARGTKVPSHKLKEHYIASMQDHDCDELVKQMDEAGIARAVLLLPDFTFALPGSRLTIAEMFERHHRILQRHAGRFVLFAGVDPRWGNDGLELFVRGVSDYGVAGLKLYPPCGYSPSHRSLDPFYEVCRSRQLPVLVHIGPTSPVLAFDKAVPGELDRAARAFPEVNFILAHGGVSHVRDCVAMCQFRPNVYLDISGFQTHIGDASPEQSLHWLFQQKINHKILFGTDWPVMRLGGSQAHYLRWLLEHPCGFGTTEEPDRCLVLVQNLERLLATAQTMKGPRLG